MKVLFLSSGNNRYGINPIIVNQADSLVRAGIDVDLYAITGKGLIGYLKNIRPLRKYLKANPLDIIHAHYGFSGIVALLARKKEKVVISFMGSDLIFNGNDSLFKKLVFYSEVIINRLIASVSYDFIIVKSNEMLSKLPDYRRKAVIPNGVNLELFEPVPKQIAQETIGLYPDHKLLVLFASDPQRTEKNFPLAQKAIQRLNTENLKLICLHGLDHKQLKYYYNAASVLILTSFHEGSPNVVKEAMACNCPVVSTDVGDVKELLENVNGCHLCSFDDKDVAEKIAKAIDFSERTNGREKILRMGLDQNTVAGKLIEIYSKLIN